jgi:prepilin-type N-terminal cleavage/methylation domain-containing protein
MMILTTKRQHRGFTLVEILVVIGIIVLLVGIAVPVYERARKQATRSRVAADLQAIATGLEAYYADYHEYPDPAAYPDATDPQFTSAKSLGMALTTKVRTRGPYIQADKFKFNSTDGKLYAGEQPILYFRAKRPKPDISAANSYVAQSSAALYDATQNLLAFKKDSGDSNALCLQRIQVMLGDLSKNGKLDPNETAVDLPYLLWAAGDDEFFGPSSASKGGVATCDDITNFDFGH